MHNTRGYHRDVRRIAGGLGGIWPMTDEEWEQIKPYAEAEAKARMTLLNHMIMNMPTDPRKALEAQVAYERAMEEATQAATALSVAKRRVLG